MKRILITLHDKLLIPFYIVVVAYFVFNYEASHLPFILVIRIILLILALIVVLGSTLSISLKRKTTNTFTPTTPLDYIYYYSECIINYTFYFALFIYIVFDFYNRSVYYDFAIIFFLGLFLGYRFCRRSFDFLRNKK